ncbi:4'-phosphopantetheinyl transferase superfamily protein [Vibrio sp. ED004]|uniref:4'-phosphopantetheinyl transferase family protein n=1 Tax=unclassified Vibrio TaxID=2614977 RepID=UPI0002F0BF7C|nr:MULTISPECIES: 4'-phosphopantetheinyl transferase superfamily protein [unclassified Vibrio]UPR56640.1 4'-phosphopantetheinyl transferase superfamily protein [Vibrio sp. ED004]
MKNSTFHPLPLDHPFMVDEFCFTTGLGFNDKKIDIHIAQFDKRHFNDKLFDITNVYCPIAITHSVDKRKAEYFAGRYLVAKELQQLGFAHQRLEPNIARSPTLPSGVAGSISHSEDLACIAVLPSRNSNRESIGIDIQHSITNDVCRDIGNMVANVDEIELMLKFGMTYSEAVTLLFSAKEAIYKALGRFVTNSLDFGSATLIAIDKVGVKFALSQQVILQTHDIISDSVARSDLRAITCQYRYLEQQQAYLTVCYCQLDK